MSGEMSNYVSSLDELSRKRYAQKLQVAGLSVKDDPYSPDRSGNWSPDMRLWPKVEYPEIVYYFITRPGTFTLEQLASWKQLEAYNYFKNNHVRTVFSCPCDGGRSVIVKAKVNPNQRSPDLAHEAWIICKKEGRILSAHCNCKAGLGEGCSHVAAILFKIECGVRLGYCSSTAQQCTWNETYCRKIEPALVVDIDFQCPIRKRDIDKEPSTTPAVRPPRPKAPKVEDKEQFLTSLRQIQPSAVVFCSLEPLPHLQAPVNSRPAIRKLPLPLSSLYKQEYVRLEEEELNALCQEKFTEGVIKISNDEAAYLEESTKLQSQSLLWFEQRIGRITASKFFSVSHANLNPPPASLIKQIMEKDSIPRHIPAIQWGITNEGTAREAYINDASEKHENFTFMPAGLHVDPSTPHLGASPDGLISCDCCGKGIIEIKCPYKFRHTDPCDICDPSFYLEKTDEGCLQLSRSHAYYCQVQGQLAICGTDFCDFICWTPLGMHNERILFDSTYFSRIRPKLDAFFIVAVLPLLLTGRTCRPQPADEPATSTTSTCTLNSSPVNYCWCRGEESGRMIACDNDKCKIEWFHFNCVGLRRKPRGKWYCSDECKNNQ